MFNLKVIINLSVLMAITSVIPVIHCAEPKATINSTITTMPFIQDDQCPLLFYYDSESNRCECIRSAFTILENIVICANNNGRLGYNFCMTYKEKTNTVSAAFCTYFALDGHNISEPGFISLPENISELNDYMCGSMNRKGVVCSECIDGYGPSVTSPKFRCSDCSSAWYRGCATLSATRASPSYNLLSRCTLAVLCKLICMCIIEGPQLDQVADNYFCCRCFRVPHL
jgi:hypothetical protein